ncbi:hypothetical protein [Fundidesulfovibrio putealis]|uniref:hypothetical protein n=1 Tax=Fundidesulfovibrio putealis TaxID=270496 RepID=UPI000684DFBA|nr:hypothetical protein [Fundidesulfovibrio putealis]
MHDGYADGIGCVVEDARYDTTHVQALLESAGRTDILGKWRHVSRRIKQGFRKARGKERTAKVVTFAVLPFEEEDQPGGRKLSTRVGYARERSTSRGIPNHNQPAII